jgi:hypothetical protein
MNHRHPVAAGYRSGSSAAGIEITAVASPALPGVLLG